MSANGADSKGLVFASVTLCRLKKTNFCDGKICRLKKPTQKAVSLVVVIQIEGNVDHGEDEFYE